MKKGEILLTITATVTEEKAEPSRTCSKHTSLVDYIKAMAVNGAGHSADKSCMLTQFVSTLANSMCHKGSQLSHIGRMRNLLLVAVVPKLVMFIFFNQSTNQFVCQTFASRNL